MVLESDSRLPDGMSCEVLVAVFRRCGFDIAEGSLTVENTCRGGGGFMSETLRVQGRTRGGDAVSLILKAPLRRAEGGRLSFAGLFRRERALYSRTLPAAEAALEAAEGGARLPLGPACLGVCGGGCLLLQDVAAADFRKAPSTASTRGLDLAHCLVALRGLARFHAVSTQTARCDAQEEPLLRESVAFGPSQAPLLQSQARTTLLKMVEVLNCYPWFRRHRDKFLQLADTLLPRAIEAVSTSNGRLTVMLHGDFQKNNMMFRYSRSELQVMFYDFQGAHIGSPAEDLQYFLHTSVSLEVLQQHTDLLLSEYHNTLQKTLHALGLDRQADAYPLEQLRREMEQLAPVGVFCTYNLLPVMLNLEVVDVELSTSCNIDRLLRKCFTNPEYLAIAEYLTPLFEKNGLLL